MSESKTNRVFKVKFKLAISDPDMPSPRYHTIIFVETNDLGPGSGTKHHVTGDIVNGMRYEAVPIEDPQGDDNLHSKVLIGHARIADYPQAWNNLLGMLPAPPKQKAFNIATMKTEPVKNWTPLTFYGPGETRRPLIKCTEWTEKQAIPALIDEGLLNPTHEFLHGLFDG